MGSRALVALFVIAFCAALTPWNARRANENIVDSNDMIRSGTITVHRVRRALPKITRPWYPCEEKESDTDEQAACTASVYPKRRTVVSQCPKRRYFFGIRDAVKCSLCGGVAGRGGR
ncbi:hypothetical protein T440DRAFT_304129 [Plenodomus tracheiphilus IPT5]|uniref:Uncharacterized protein n=1 Tax=Plenodomus tracheiphilus IPT5 TaxID=1408161 RepID=A0A6A7BDD7_9PLEO|nr:hypothetical protein T440DRAFT_304129 [Plenodomus tracheiphilus IPT5]